MLSELNASGCGPAQNGGRIPLTALRNHPCFQPPKESQRDERGHLMTG